MRIFVVVMTILVFCGAFAYVSHSAMIRYGDPPYTEMDDYFIRNGQEQTGANNIVTSVVFDYRGFDTLGEASVLFTAVLGVGITLRKGSEWGGKEI